MSIFGDDLLQSMQEALAHAYGERNDLVKHRMETDALDPKAVRGRLKLTHGQRSPGDADAVAGHGGSRKRSSGRY